MIVLFTDFGLHGPYTGQMKAVLQQKGAQHCCR
jgi:S-adenosyl-L-methionine hydrolase (adenosine-forming)